MAFNEKLPKWDNVGVEPPESKKTEGWQPTEKPPAQWFNWIFNRIYKTLEEIRTKAVEKETGKGLSTNDYTTVEKTKLADIEIKANKTVIVNNLTETVVGKALDATQGKTLNDNLTTHKAEKATQSNLGHIKLTENWITGILENGWTGTLRYRKDDLGLVTVEMNNCGGSVVASNTVICTLPDGYRPREVIVAPLYNGGDSRVENNYIKIASNGKVSIPLGTTVTANKGYYSVILF